jgi:hypothetical protein
MEPARAKQAVEAVQRVMAMQHQLTQVQTAQKQIAEQKWVQQWNAYSRAQDEAFDARHPELKDPKAKAEAVGAIYEAAEQLGASAASNCISFIIHRKADLRLCRKCCSWPLGSIADRSNCTLRRVRPRGRPCPRFALECRDRAPAAAMWNIRLSPENSTAQEVRTRSR